MLVISDVSKRPNSSFKCALLLLGSHSTFEFVQCSEFTCTNLQMYFSEFDSRICCLRSKFNQTKSFRSSSPSFNDAAHQVLCTHAEISIALSTNSFIYCLDFGCSGRYELIEKANQYRLKGMASGLTAHAQYLLGGSRDPTY